MQTCYCIYWKNLTNNYSLHNFYKSRTPTKGEQIPEMYFLPSQASIRCEPSSHSQLTKKLQDKKAKKVQALHYKASNLATHLIIINDFHNKRVHKFSNHNRSRPNCTTCQHLLTIFGGKKYKRDSHTVQFQTLLHYRKAAPIPRGPYTISEARDVAPMLWYPHCSPIMEYEAPSNLVCLISVPPYPPHLQYHQKLENMHSKVHQTS